MAMLAEPRRRQRIGPNPRGKFYAEQDNNFGKILLQKMGWKNGDGLGLERQGISEAIRPKNQMSSNGLGYDHKANPWVEHNREFEEILKNLNEASTIHSQEHETKDESQELEKKSKKSRARIHYHKFVKGKDLSRASSEDLKSIFGNTTCGDQSVNFQPMAQSLDIARNSSITKEEESIETRTVVTEKEGDNTINRGSMVDYFKHKMEKKRLAALGDSAGDLNDSFVKAHQEKTMEGTAVPEKEEDINTVKGSKVKKSKQNQMELTELDASAVKEPSAQFTPKNENVNRHVNTEENGKKDTEKQKRKRKRLVEIATSSSTADDDIQIEDIQVTLDAGDMDAGEPPVPKAKKKKKCNRVVEEEEKVLVDESVGHEIQIINEEIVTTKKKRRKNNRAKLTEEDSVELLVGTTLSENTQPEHVELEIESKDFASPKNNETSETSTLTLEEKLKLEMENLKNSKQRKRQLYFSSLDTVSKKFKGSNVHKINGYFLY